MNGVVIYLIHRGSNMRAHVVLNFSTELWKRNKMRGLPSILSLFRNGLNKSNTTEARMLDFFPHVSLKLLKHRIFGVNTSNICHILRSVIMDVIIYVNILYYVYRICFYQFSKTSKLIKYLDIHMTISPQCYSCIYNLQCISFPHFPFPFFLSILK